MNPNKKTLSSKTNNSPWLLCPSKSFPGKFYYFNGSTGETAWSLNDSDHNNLNKDIHRVEDIAHPYGEPFGPPGDENTNSSSSSLPKEHPFNGNFNNTTKFNGLSFSHLSNLNKGKKFNNQTHFSNLKNVNFGSNLNGARSFGNFNKAPQINFPSVTPGWGQPVFPSYLNDKSYSSKVVWTLTPMLVNEEPFQMFDQSMQYNSPEMFLHNPLQSNVFQPFNRPQTNPFYKVNSSTSTGVQMGKPTVRYESKDVQTFDQEPLTKEEGCQTFESEQEPVQIRTEVTKPVLQPSKFGVKFSCTSVGNSNSVNDVGNVTEINNVNKSLSLGENDLRFLLEAKRRQSVDSSEGQKTMKDMATSQSKENTPKKRVTFNLGDKEDGEVPENIKKRVSTSTPRKLVFQSKPEISYIVADSEVLMANYEDIENKLLEDENCHLLVPYVVKSKMEAISRGEGRGRYGVFAARFVLRKLTTLRDNVVIQREPDHIISCEEDSILDCCWQYSQDCYLSLLTNNTELIRKSEIIGINCSSFDPFKQQITTVDGANNVDTDTQKNNNKASTNNNVESINLFEFPQTDLVDLDISKLDIRDDRRNQSEPINKKINKGTKTDMERAKNDIKVSGITKLNSVFNIDEELARYYIKNEVMEQRLVSRTDEWISRLNLAMEGSLNDVLLKEKVKKNMPPKDLQELVQNIGNTFKKHTKIRSVTERLLSHLERNITKFSKVHPVDFIKLLGFCMILIQCLKEILDYEELCDVDDLLSELLKHIEDPNTDVELSLERVSTPVPSEVRLETKVPLGYRKKQSNVIEYLKKHFPGAFLSKNEAATVPKIVRTVGKDLNAIKVFNTKDIMDNTSNVTQNVEPKIVKKFKFIEAFEERLKKKCELDMFDDNEESISTILSDQTVVLNDRSINNEDNRKKNKFDSNEDTGYLSCEIESECLYAYPLMKSFLTELRTTFVMIFNFVSDTMQDEQSPLPENERSELDFKINKAYDYIIQIVSRLKSIIARESGSGTTLKMLLIRAGDYVEENESMSHYKELITKYLEQANILADALELLLAIRNSQQETVYRNSV